MIHVGLLLLGIGASVFAREIRAEEVFGSMRPLLVRAIDYPTETVQGVIVGPIAEKFTSQLQVATPLLAEARVVKDFDEDCKRLAVRFIKKDVPSTQGRRDLVVGMELNMCRNGMPPSAGMDLSRVARILGRQGDRP